MIGLKTKGPDMDQDQAMKGPDTTIWPHMILTFFLLWHFDIDILDIYDIFIFCTLFLHLLYYQDWNILVYTKYLQ